MAICPKCESNISDEFGLVNCGHCGSSVFVDLEGSVKLAEDMSQSADFSSANFDDGQSKVVVGEEGEPQVFINEEIPPGEGEWVEQNSVVQAAPDLSAPDSSEEQYEMDDYEAADEGESADMQPSDELLEELPEDSQPLEEIAMEDSEEPLMQASEELESYEDYAESPPEGAANSTGEGDLALESPSMEGESYDLEPSPTVTNDSSMQDVRDFGNSNLSAASDGSIKYKIKISGIDDPAVRAEIKEALTDSRFLWEASDLMASIKSGELVISGISPVKASVLISRLKPVNVQIYWEQYVLQVHDTADAATSHGVDELEP